MALFAPLRPRCLGHQGVRRPLRCDATQRAWAVRRGSGNGEYPTGNSFQPRARWCGVPAGARSPGWAPADPSWRAIGRFYASPVDPRPFRAPTGLLPTRVGVKPASVRFSPVAQAPVSIEGNAAMVAAGIQQRVPATADHVPLLRAAVLAFCDSHGECDEKLRWSVGRAVTRAYPSGAGMGRLCVCDGSGAQWR
jgi:hypothetical protein